MAERPFSADVEKAANMIDMFSLNAAQARTLS
jgi:hypothetical protein